MTPLEALGWVLVVFLAYAGSAFAVFWVGALKTALRRHRDGAAPAGKVCGSRGPDGLVCQRAPGHPRDGHAAVQDSPTGTRLGAELVKW